MTALTTPVDTGSTTRIWAELSANVPRADTPQVSWHRSSAVLHCRRAHRVAFPEPLQVVGLAADSDNGRLVVDSGRMIARGRDISVGGISFEHGDPLPHQLVAVSFRSPFGTKTLVAKLSWCRFAREGHYMSGGRLVDNPQLDVDFDIDWETFPAS